MYRRFRMHCNVIDHTQTQKNFPWIHNYDETVTARNQVKYRRQFAKKIEIIADYFYSILRCNFSVFETHCTCDFSEKKM